MLKTIGILGGMGPLATIDFVHKMISNTPAKSDQQHIPMIIYNNPQIPSRLDAFKPDRESPLPELIRSALLLERSGAHFIVMPCHSAHYWLQQIQQAIQIPLYSMIDCTVEYLACHSKQEEILLIASKTTIRSKLYQQAMHKAGLKLVLPDEDDQERINKLIQFVKANGHFNTAVNELNDILSRYLTIKKVIAGCTEIPLLLEHRIVKRFEFIDPTLLMALKAIELAQDVKAVLHKK